ncbi:crossover junction endodeoxyribonuclease RuvC [Niabella hibiscisoli]|uniref:crossover junction endodeoxyribonuclease RuvC n=1 Tax=Niabella hibiscisoli TaxID=1825928 RepID=UPI001F0D0EB7|nr:crossover junction endodeoxyribonuclease RuvC [Niabella hibiscisoli]MCH5717250.1 crossover junction endodeoxyribonuclease RuvC [Niabella hibiscisoli]
MQESSKIILGIDPGTIIMGYGIIACQRQKIQLLEMHALKLPAKKSNYERLNLIHQKVTELIKTYRPTEFAIEAPFFGKNVQSMLKLGRAQGVAIAAAMHYDLPITEYSPKKVKLAVTGNGNAEKEQVWKMLQQTMNIKELPQYFDATDALAVAVCHHYQILSPIPSSGSFKGWDDFIKKNPERVK